MTPEQAISMIRELKQYVANSTASFLFNKLHDTEDVFKKRIFDQGQNAFNSGIGDYWSKIWMETRLARGRQVDYVDLQFTGDLRNSINTFPTKTGAKLEIKGGKELSKANYQEGLQGEKSGGGGDMDIFSLSEKEAKELEEIVEKEYSQYLDKILDKYA